MASNNLKRGTLTKLAWKLEEVQLNIRVLSDALQRSKNEIVRLTAAIEVLEMRKDGKT